MRLLLFRLYRPGPANEYSAADSRHWHFGAVGAGQRQLCGHAGAKSSQRGLADAGIHFRLPGTLVTFFAVTEGGERAYGIDLPRKGRA
jgi:hypothetical protein